MKYFGLASKKNNYHYNKNLKNYASENRKNMTIGEATIWKYVLKNRQMEGYQFRRQRPVLNYIVDFACLELLLIIEIDGFTHDDADQYEKDKRRQIDLEKIGFSLLRFSDWEVRNKMEEVLYNIENWIKNNSNIPPPSPRQRRKLN